MLQVENLSVNFGKTSVLNDINVIFDDTGINIIIGINGSGKTTLLHTLAGMYKVPTHARITCNGNYWGSEKYKRSIFISPQISICLRS
ncbi:MAG: ATP-binding cassette domain-containing protein [Actinomycetaceae bacterium]|nr:ATP-binding cassette domain-containing protein [Actinomycetaceae bacterium]